MEPTIKSFNKSIQEIKNDDEIFRLQNEYFNRVKN